MVALFCIIQKCLHQEWVDCLDLGGHGNQDRHAMLYGIIIFSTNESKERVAKKKKTSKQGFH